MRGGRAPRTDATPRRRGRTRQALRARAGRSLVAALVVTTVAAALWPHPVSAQCAMCRTALNSPEGRALIAAFQRGILLLLAVPFALIVGIAALAVRSQRRLLAGEGTAPEPPAAQPGTAPSRRPYGEATAGALGADTVR